MLSCLGYNTAILHICHISHYLFISLSLIFVFCIADGSVDLSAFSLIHAMPWNGVPRYAVASLGDEIFVASHINKSIEVYDATTFAFKHSLTVPGLTVNCYGLAACKSNNCLYASDYLRNTIHKADLSGRNGVVKWSVGSQPAGLSVNKAHNVVVACLAVNKVQEYTTDGGLVRKISLKQTGCTNPWHAVQLSTGEYVVSYCTSPGVVSVVGVDGQVVHRCDQSQTSRIGSINAPRSIAVTKNDDILVADNRNHRIVLMNSSLSSVQVLALPVDGGIQNPWGLCLDESRGRLYVAECDGQCRVLVFESVAINR